MSGPFESVQWNACVHRLDLSLYSHLKVFEGKESEPMVTQGKDPRYLNVRGGLNPQHAGQQAQHTTN